MTWPIYSHPTHCKPSPSEHIPNRHHYHPILSTPITAPTPHPHPLHTHTWSTDLTKTQPAPHTHSDSPPSPPSSDPTTSHHYQNIQSSNSLHTQPQWKHTKPWSISSNSVNPPPPPPPPPPPHTHTHTHTQSTDLTNTQPAPHTHSDSTPFSIIQWRNHLSPLSQNIVIQLIAHPAPMKTYKVIIQIIQLCQQSPQSTDLTTLSTNSVSTTPSQHHPHTANTLIQPHSPTGLDISGNYSLPTFFRNFTFFNIDYIDGLVQNCSLSIANALEILHSCTKPSIFDLKDNVAQIHLPGWQFYLPWLSEWLNLTAFLGTADSEVHIVHISQEQLIWTIWTSLSAVPRKAVKFNHSLDRQAVGYIEPCLITQSTCIVNQLITHTHPWRQQRTHAKYLDGASNVWAFSELNPSDVTQALHKYFPTSCCLLTGRVSHRDYTIIITIKPLI